MERLRPGKIIAEKIDRVDVHDIGVANKLEHRRSKRIPPRAAKGNTNDLRAVDQIVRRQYAILRGIEESVERYDAHAVAGANLRRGQFSDHALESTDSRIKLTHDVHNVHRRLPIGPDRDLPKFRGHTKN